MKILYDMDRSESRPFMLVRPIIDRRKSNLVFTVLDRFASYADAEAAMPYGGHERRALLGPESTEIAP